MAETIATAESSLSPQTERQKCTQVGASRNGMSALNGGLPNPEDQAQELGQEGEQSSESKPESDSEHSDAVQHAADSSATAKGLTTKKMKKEKPTRISVGFTGAEVEAEVDVDVRGGVTALSVTNDDDDKVANEAGQWNNQSLGPKVSELVRKLDHSP